MTGLIKQMSQWNVSSTCPSPVPASLKSGVEVFVSPSVDVVIEMVIEVVVVEADIPEPHPRQRSVDVESDEVERKRMRRMRRRRKYGSNSFHDCETFLRTLWLSEGNRSTYRVILKKGFIWRF